MGRFDARLRLLEERLCKIAIAPGLSAEELRALGPEELVAQFVLELESPPAAGQSLADKLARLTIRWRDVDGSSIYGASLAARAEFGGVTAQAEAMVTQRPPAKQECPPPASGDPHIGDSQGAEASVQVSQVPLGSSEWMAISEAFPEFG